MFEGRTFQVQAVNDLDERHREIQVTAVEVVGRGTTPGGAPVNVPPTITVGPVGATIDAGESVILTVIAAGAAPLVYQWTADGADLAGEIYQFLETGPLDGDDHVRGAGLECVRVGAVGAGDRDGRRADVSGASDRRWRGGVLAARRSERDDGEGSHGDV